MSYDDGDPMSGAGLDAHARANPQELYAGLRQVGSVTVIDGHALVAGDDAVRHVLQHPEVYSSGIDAVHIGQVRPLIPLQIDPPEHKTFRRILDPLFSPKQVALLEESTRSLVRQYIQLVADRGGCNFHEAVAEPLPTTVFLRLLGLPESRLQEFLVLKDGIIRPDTLDPDERIRMVDATGAKIYAILQEVLDARVEEPRDDFMSLFLDAEVDGHTLTHEQILDIGYLFFLAGLDTVTASLDCIIAFLAQHPEHRRRLVDDPAVIPHAVEEILRWETPVQGVIRITTEDTELAGCPIEKATPVRVVLGSGNTDEAVWDRPDTVDFDRTGNKHLAFGGGAHRCLGSHLARMELRVALEEWHAAVPDYSLVEGNELLYSVGLRSVENLELVW